MRMHRLSFWEKEKWMNKVILISVDGMRPDGFLACGNPYIRELMEKASYTLTGRTVFPSVTLPCHLSLFHSVPPERHGTLTNTYVPPVHPVKGLFEQAAAFGACCAMYYNWDPIRQVASFDCLKHSAFVGGYEVESSDTVNTDRALDVIRTHEPDFIFLYMVDTDEKGGHDNGWMSDEYLRRIGMAVDNIRRVVEACGDRYTVIITADHGGHDRSHGTDREEDMTIPMFFLGERFAPGRVLEGLSILDLAPTIADVMGILPVPEWEGKSAAQ